MRLKEATAFIVCVDYCDFLKVTLPRNRPHFKDVIVITSHSDDETIEYCIKCDLGVGLFMTNAFYDSGALFNKWRGLNESLIKFSSGLTCLLDSDILLPAQIPDFDFQIGHLYTPRRRMVRDEAYFKAIEDRDFGHFAYPMPNEEFAGYCQIFHSDDPVLGCHPWHQQNWRHAGGADSFFQMKWAPEHKIRPPFEVLHFGEDGKNWAGRVTPRIDGKPIPDEMLRRAEELKQLISKREGRKRLDRYRAEQL